MPDHTISEFYTPLPHQAAYHECQAPYRLSVGGAGSGKTLCGVMEAILTCLLVPGSNNLIMRTTHPDLKKTVIDKVLDTRLVPRWVYKSYNQNDRILYFDNGSKIFFGHCQFDADVNQYLSTEFATIHLEEGGEFSFRIWEVLTGRARSSTSLRDVNGNPVKPSIGITTNPMGSGWPWIKKLFVEKKPMPGMGGYDPNDYWYIHSTVVDCPYVYTPDYIKKLESMTGTLRAQFLYGDMNVVGGQLFPQFNTGNHEGLHIMEPKEIKFIPYEPVWCGSDFGIAHHWPTLWMTKARVPDALHPGLLRSVNVVYRERVFHEMNVQQVASSIIDACVCERDNGGRPKRITEPIKKFFLSWERFMRRESLHTIAEQLGDKFVKYGMPRPTPAHKNRVEGWALIGQLLDMDELVITTECPLLISAIPTMVRDTPNNPEDAKKAETMEDDLMDALRYAVASYMKPGKVPPGMVEDQQLMAISDPLARKIKAFELWNKKQENKGPMQDRRVLPWEVRT